MNAIVSEKAWRAKGVELFGEDTDRWEFVCPRCKLVMSIDKARASYADQLRDTDYRVETACIGRHIRGVGCDWAAYGLFSGPVFVEREGGKKTPVFDFAGLPFTGEARG